MTPQTVSLTLSTSNPHRLLVSAYNANTLILSCVGDLSSGWDTLKAEIHDTEVVGETPLAESEYESALGAGPHEITFTAAQMNQLPASERVRERRYYLVVIGRNGFGASIVKSVLAKIDLTLLQSPAGATAAPAPAVSTFLTQEEADERYYTQAKVDALIASNTVCRFVTATLLSGESSFVVNLQTGETVAGVMLQAQHGLTQQGVVSVGTAHTIHFSDAAPSNITATITVKLA